MANATTPVIQVNEGKVGIGIVSPTTPLHLIGIAQIVTSSDTAFYEGASVRMFGAQSYSFRSSGGNTRAVIDVNATGVSAGNLSLYNASSVVTNYINNAGDSYFNGGKVGIGTTNPGAQLEVRGANSRVTANSTADGQFIGFQAQYLNSSILQGSFLYSTGGATLSIANHFNGNNSSYSDIYFKNCNNASSTLQTRMTIRGSSGNVGIGVINPETSRLLVRGSTNDSSSNIFQASNLGGATKYVVRADGDNKWYKGDNGLSMILNSTGEVGIGLTNPLNRLVVSGVDTNAELDGTTVTQAALQLSNSDFAYGTFFGTQSSGTGLIQQRRQASEVYYPLALNPYGGRIGIGIVNPSSKLHVVGSTRLTGGSFGVSTDASVSSSFSYSFRDAVGINNPNSVSAPAVPGYVMTVGRSNVGGVSGGIYVEGESRFVRGLAGAINFNAYGAGILISDASGNITTYGGTTPPSGLGAAGRITIWDSATELGSDTQLNWNFTDNRLGILSTAPAYNLDVIGSARVYGFLNTSNYMQKLLPTLVFPNSVANQNIDIKFGNISFWGYVEVEITGTYSNQNTSGKLTKLYAVGTNPSIIYTNESRVSDSLGEIGNNIALGDFRYDNTTGSETFAIKVSHIVATGNNYTVKVKVFTHGSSSASVGARAAFANLTIGSRYTETALTKNYVNYNDNVGIGTTSPSQTLEVHSTIKIGETGVTGGRLISADSMIFQIDSDNSSTASSYRFRKNGTGDNGTELMRIQEDGKVGIGITLPADKLDLFDVNDNVGVYFHTTTSGTGAGQGLRVGQNNSNAFVWNYENTPLSLATNGSAKITVNGNGTIRFNTYSAGTLVTDGSGNITSTSTPPGTGTFLPLAGGTMTGNTLHGDNIKSIYGAGNDLQIFHNGSNYISSLVKDTYYTGTADVGTSAFSQIFKQTNFNGGDEEYLRISGPTRQVLFSRDAKFFDNIKCTFGTSATNSLGDLRIYHDATDSKIENLTGDLYIINESLDKDVIIQSDNGATGEVTDYFRADGSTGNSILYGDYGTRRLEATNTGVTITGILSGLTNPTAAQDAATKDYVDTAVSGAGTVTSVTTTAPVTVTQNGGGSQPNIAITSPGSGDWFNGGVPRVGSDGLMEIGRYVDFHNTNAATTDFDVRLDCYSTGNLRLTGSFNITSDLVVNSQIGAGITPASGITIQAEGKIRSSDDNSADHFDMYCDGSNTGDSFLENTNGRIVIKSEIGTTAIDAPSIAATLDILNASNTATIRFKSGADSFIAGGDLGIGNTAPTSGIKLDVTGKVLIKTTTGVSDLYLGNFSTAKYVRFHTNNIDTYFDMGCGNVYWRNPSSIKMTFDVANGNMTIDGTLTQNSDIRVKENVVEIDDCISKVQAMRGVYYNRNDVDKKITKVGVIAQEVEAVLPELILEHPKDGLKSVAYSELTAVLINAIKEQQQIIEDLKTRVKQLEINN